MSGIQELRQTIERELERNLWPEARRHLTELWQRDPKMSTANYVVNRFERLREHLSLVPCRLAILRSFTVEPLVPLVRAGAFNGGIDLSVYTGQFNAYAQEILVEGGDLYKFDPDIVILAVQTRDIAPDLSERIGSLSPGGVTPVVERVVQSFQDLVYAFRARSDAHLILHSLEEPATSNQRSLDRRIETAQIAAIQHINRELFRIATDVPGVYVLDYDGLIALHGRGNWHDESKWITLRMPIAADKLAYLAKEWLRFVHPLSGRICRVLVTDLDNTLWGGIIGEDGIDGINCGSPQSGADYLSLQQTMLDLYERGVLLAICSKNNEVDAMEVLGKHQDMLLRPHHFAAMRINWEDKVQNIREIAAELKIGTDYFAYIDDSPVERERVRVDLPEVCVIELPANTADHADAVRSHPVFSRLTVSEEDKQRHHYYAQQRQRVELKQETPSLEDFYYSLEQTVEIARVIPEAVERVAQLTQKTNQFNLTARRYSTQQIIKLNADSAWRVFTMRARDRFGDNGLVGVAITHDDDRVCEIDTFLLSCRVIGRTLEVALLSFLLERAKAFGVERLQGLVLPTKQNIVATGFYSNQGFQLIEKLMEGALWGLDPSCDHVQCPSWIQLTVAEGAFS